MAKHEKVKRLKPLPDTLRELYIRSGNLCAFPGCNQLMMDVHGNFIGQVCHIEGAEEGGERFNPNMSNEERRHVSNLVLMCYPHHTETNDVNRFPTPKMKAIKEDHEKRFSSPERAIMASLKDYTADFAPEYPINLLNLNRALGGRYDSSDLPIYAQELRSYIDKIKIVPIELRDFLAKISERIHKLRHTDIVKTGYPVAIRTSDIERAFGLSGQSVYDIGQQCEGYRIGRIDEVTTGEGWAYHFIVYGTQNDFPVWLDIAEFCESTATTLERFSVDLDFSALDD